MCRRLKYASMLAVDGNFHLQRNHKGRPDLPLSGNSGFWVDQGEFEDYVTAKKAKYDEDARVCGVLRPKLCLATQTVYE